MPAIHANGTAIVLVEQSVNTALRLADRAVFMEKGEVRFDGPTAELLERRDLLRSVFLEGAARSGVGGNGIAARAASGPATEPPGGGAQAAACVAGERKDTALEVVELTRRYGGVMALDKVSLQLREGEILGLIGPNGAGKTTLFDLVSGFQALDGGRVLLHGQDVTRLPAHARARAGLGRSFQNAPALAVPDRPRGRRHGMRARGRGRCRAAGLPAPADGRRLRSADQRRGSRSSSSCSTSSATATSSSRSCPPACGGWSTWPFSWRRDPVVLLLDEPSSGIAQRETEALGPVLLDLRRQLGCSLLVIEHDMPLITGLADRLVALDAGGVIATGPPQQVLEDPLVVESYLGRGWETDARFESSTTD